MTQIKHRKQQKIRLLYFRMQQFLVVITLCQKTRRWVILLRFWRQNWLLWFYEWSVRLFFIFLQLCL